METTKFAFSTWGVTLRALGEAVGESVRSASAISF